MTLDVERPARGVDLPPRDVERVSRGLDGEPRGLDTAPHDVSNERRDEHNAPHIESIASHFADKKSRGHDIDGRKVDIAPREVVSDRRDVVLVRLFSPTQHGSNTVACFASSKPPRLVARSSRVAHDAVAHLCVTMRSTPQLTTGNHSEVIMFGALGLAVEVTLYDSATRDHCARYDSQQAADKPWSYDPETWAR